MGLSQAYWAVRCLDMATAFLDWAEGNASVPFDGRLRIERNGIVADCIEIRYARFPGYERQMNVANVLKNVATHWAATRWRLRFLVELAQSLRASA